MMPLPYFQENETEMVDSDSEDDAETDNRIPIIQKITEIKLSPQISFANLKNISNNSNKHENNLAQLPSLFVTSPYEASSAAIDIHEVDSDDYRFNYSSNGYNYGSSNIILLPEDQHTWHSCATNPGETLRNEFTSFFTSLFPAMLDSRINKDSTTSPTTSIGSSPNDYKCHNFQVFVHSDNTVVPLTLRSSLGLGSRKKVVPFNYSESVEYSEVRESIQLLLAQLQEGLSNKVGIMNVVLLI